MNSLQAFNPDAFVARATGKPLEIVGTIPGIRASDYAGLPEEWARGLHLLNTIDAPRGAERDRWHQIVLDAHRFAWGWQAEAIQQGWTIGSLFGFDPRQPTDDNVGLVLTLRGDRVVSMSIDDRGRAVAAISGTSSYRNHYRRPLDNLPPIWVARVAK
jgi:hypothetical protein